MWISFSLARCSMKCPNRIISFSLAHIAALEVDPPGCAFNPTHESHQNLSDEGLECISKCKNLVSLNLTWCVRVTDKGVIAVAQSCTSLEFGLWFELCFCR
ncbi:uncharacterized protein LOC131652144 [Vicia villosa]|uniref:uncharacterized protein LOC131652144 n=1 Tax=Vicia villosa TaxID=3911 RepID=UPI00273C9B46|nr:uncharacterized protein LOC131652144 [Vicia villosa]